MWRIILLIENTVFFFFCFFFRYQEHCIDVSESPENHFQKICYWLNLLILTEDQTVHLCIYVITLSIGNDINHAMFSQRD